MSPLAFVHPEVKLGDNNIIGPLCYIGKSTVIGDNNMFQNSVTTYVGTRLGNSNGAFSGASISIKPQDLKFRNEETLCETGDNNSIHENAIISHGMASKDTIKVGSNNPLMECMHIVHDCVIGSDNTIGNAARFASEATVDDSAIISADILCHQFCRIGGYAMMQGGSHFSMDIPPYIIIGKEPARYMGINLAGLRHRGFSNGPTEPIHNTYRTLYGTGTRAENIQKIKNELRITPEVQKIIDFVESSERGTTR